MYQTVISVYQFDALDKVEYILYQHKSNEISQSMPYSLCSNWFICYRTISFIIILLNKNIPVYQMLTFIYQYGLAQCCDIHIINTLKILQSCTMPSIFDLQVCKSNITSGCCKYLTRLVEHVYNMHDHVISFNSLPWIFLLVGYRILPWNLHLYMLISIDITDPYMSYINGLVQDCSISNVVAMDILINPQCISNGNTTALN